MAGHRDPAGTLSRTSTIQFHLTSRRILGTQQKQPWERTTERPAINLLVKERVAVIRKLEAKQRARSLLMSATSWYDSDYLCRLTSD